MGHAARELKFPATPEKGEVSALLVRPAGASHLLVLGHGASTTMRHDPPTSGDRPPTSRPITLILAKLA